MAGGMFTKCVGTADKWNQVMKLIGHLRWVDCLRLFDQGSRPFPTDVKKENVTHLIDKPTGDKPNDSDRTQMEIIQLAGGIAKPTWKPRVQTNRLLLEWCCSDTSFFLNAISRFENVYFLLLINCLGSFSHRRRKLPFGN